MQTGSMQEVLMFSLPNTEGVFACFSFYSSCAFLTRLRYNGSTGKPSEAGMFMKFQHAALLSIVQDFD